MRDVGDLLVGQARRRLAALRRMALLQKWSDLAAVAIAKKDDRSKKIGTVIRAARLRAVTRHALRDPDVLPLVGQRKIHEWFIRRTGRATTSAAAARWRRIGLSSPCTRASSSRGWGLRRLRSKRNDDHRPCQQCGDTRASHHLNGSSAVIPRRKPHIVCHGMSPRTRARHGRTQAAEEHTPRKNTEEHGWTPNWALHDPISTV